MVEKKYLVYLEISLVVMSIFSFSYMISEATEGSERNYLFEMVSSVFDKVKQPIFPMVSAAGVKGCCSKTKAGQICANSVSIEDCSDGANFAAGAACTGVNFCDKGCCYIEDEGIYDKSVLQEFCPHEWAPDEFCNLPGAALGCCVLGENTRFETPGQCKVHTEVFALSEDFEVDWRDGLNELECVLLAGEQRVGACVMADGTCKFGTEADCMSLDGEFHEDLLCTASSLNTTCEMTEKTKCVDGKDGVYFVDSCGNIANIYDSTRAKDPEYWRKHIPETESCSAPNGARNSKTCGNCNRFEGGICSAAEPDDFDVAMGDYYCRDTACSYTDFWGQTTLLKNGEAFCVYEGPIGEGDDVPGSRHFRYICNFGTVQVEPCADYRNEICVERDTMSMEGTSVTNDIYFNNAVCRKNNAKHCIEIGETSMAACRDEPDCMVRSVNVGGSFDFDICVPMYPEGFSFEPQYQATGSQVCAINTRTCVVTFQPVGFVCVCVDNCGCRGWGHKASMEEICQALGDCQGFASVPNYYEARPVKGQVAEYDPRIEKYLKAAGLTHDDYLGVGSALFDNSAFAGSMFASEIDSNKNRVPETPQGMSPAQMGAIFTAIGSILAAIGSMIGSMLATMLGLAMSLIGAILAMLQPPVCPPEFYDYNCKLWEPPSGGNCDVCNEDKDIPCTEYRCKSLGTSCEFINEGTTDELCITGVDDGSFPVVTKILTVDEIIEAENLYDFPELLEFIQDVNFREIKENHLEITNPNGGCLDAYSAIPISFETQIASQCKFDMEWNNEGKKDYDDMDYFVGSSSYTLTHSTFFQLPDPSHGEAQGYEGIHPEMTLYVKCKAWASHMMPDYLEMDMCVNEGPDETAPRILAHEPKTDSYVSFDKDTFNFTLMTLELAECRWDYSDLVYDQMINNLTCNDSWGAPSGGLGYLCTGVLPINKSDEGPSDSTFYMRCKDQPWLTGENASNRNANAESFVFVYHRPEKKITIDSLSPSGELLTTADKMSIDYQVKTSGGGENHTCAWSLASFDPPLIEFLETGYPGVHLQPLDLESDKYTIYVECRDETGDSAQAEGSLSIIRKSHSPLISRVWQSSGNLYFITEEVSECSYSEENCRFDFEDGGSIGGDGIRHRIQAIKGKTYYVKCKDELGNLPTSCSIVLNTV